MAGPDKRLYPLVNHEIPPGWDITQETPSYHPPAEIPAKADVIRGKRMATVPKCKFDIELCGAAFVDEPVVVADNMVSARTWHDYSPFFPVFMRMLHKASRSR